MALELERKEDYFIISGLRYETSEAMEIADFIAHTLHIEHQFEIGQDEVKAKYNNECPF
jgi:ATP:corrinoid adenosyltransferase